jgi:methyl-accepting chemotaxis protein
MACADFQKKVRHAKCLTCIDAGSSFASEAGAAMTRVLAAISKLRDIISEIADASHSLDKQGNG